MFRLPGLLLPLLKLCSSRSGLYPTRRLEVLRKQFVNGSKTVLKEFASVAKMNRAVNHFYEFGSLRLDATNRQLCRNGVELPLQPRLMETLIALIENANTLVTRDSLINAVWGETAVEEGGLKRNISMLRKALGEEGRFIENFPKRGYRFTAEVREAWEDILDAPTFGRATELVRER